MAIGVYTRDNYCIGGEFASGGGDVPVLKTLLRTVPSGKTCRSVIGIDSDNIRTEQFFSPETNDKKLRQTINLQREYYSTEEESAKTCFCPVYEKTSRGTGVLLLGIAATATTLPGVAVFPAYIALYAIAYKRGLIKNGSNRLILFFCEGQVTCVTVAGESIVYSRRFSDNPNLATNLKLSSQSVFFVQERHLIDPETSIVISVNPDDAKRVEMATGGAAKVEYIDVSGYFPDNELSDSDRMRLVLAYGMSLVPRVVPLSHWNLRVYGSGHWDKSKFVALRCVAMLLIALPLIFGAEIITDQILIDRLDRKMTTVEPLFNRVSEIITDVDAMDAFARGSGRDRIGPDICYKLLNEIDRVRGPGLKLTSLAGNPYSTIAINGQAGSYPVLLELLESLEKSTLLASSELIYANQGDNGVIDFQIILKYKFSREFSVPKTDETGDGQS